MRHNRHIVLANPDKEDTPIKIYEYDNSLTIWVGYSPELFTPKEGKTVEAAVDTFVASLRESGYEIVSNDLLPA